MNDATVDTYNDAGAKAWDCLPLGKYFDTQADAEFLNRLVIVKSGITFPADDYSCLFKDPKTDEFFIAIGNGANGSAPIEALTGLIGRQEAARTTFEEIKRKSHIIQSDYELYRVFFPAAQPVATDV